MARQRMATAVGRGGATSHSGLEGMTRAEVSAKCLVLRSKCAEKDSTIRELRGQLRNSNARADAAEAENGRLERRYSIVKKFLQRVVLWSVCFFRVRVLHTWCFQVLFV